MQKLQVIILLLLSLGCAATAQVYPGDANNNGRVDQQDILYIGYAYGSNGPARQEQGTEYAEAELLLGWDQTFPGGLNLAYADANGDGQVNILDFTAVFINYGLETPPVTEPEYPVSTSMNDPQLRLGPPVYDGPLTEGVAVEVPILLSQPAPDSIRAGGLAFSLRYDEAYVKDVTVQFDTQWLGGEDEVFRFQNHDPQQANLLDVALTRYGPVQGNAEGTLGTLSFIIEDDLITFMEKDSSDIRIQIEDILLLDSLLQARPVEADSISMVVYRPDAIVDSKEPSQRPDFRCYPMPVTGGQLHLESAFKMAFAELLNPQGSVFRKWSFPLVRHATLSLDKCWPPGWYLLRIRGSEGKSHDELILIH